MPRIRQWIIAVSLAALFVVSATPAGAEFRTEREHAPATIDAMILRPLGFVGAVVSAALFVPVAAITLAVQPSDIDKPFQALVVKPFEYVFVDPLGEH